MLKEICAAVSVERFEKKLTRQWKQKSKTCEQKIYFSMGSSLKIGGDYQLFFISCEVMIRGKSENTDYITVFSSSCELEKICVLLIFKKKIIISQKKFVCCPTL